MNKDNIIVIYDNNQGSKELEVGVISFSENGKMIIRVYEKENRK
jgi:hypothetical protein